jgi:hypothetical protein
VKVLVCGGRDYKNTAEMYHVLDKLHLERTFTMLIEGDARGADKLAGKWAEDRGVQLVKVPANWAGQGLAAGTKRNTLMLDLIDVDLVVAFTGGTGTSNMMFQAYKRGIEIIDVETFS